MQKKRLIQFCVRQIAAKLDTANLYHAKILLKNLHI